MVSKASVASKKRIASDPAAFPDWGLNTADCSHVTCHFCTQLPFIHLNSIFQAQINCITY